MPDLFVDTSGWGNLADRSQRYHQLASNLYRLARQRKHKIVTTNYVVKVMEQMGINESLTNDHHFEQAGFIRLLK